MSSDSRTRTYRGGSLEELAPRIERELGADAIILRRREGLTGGVLGFFQRSFVEIEAVAGGPRIDVYDEEERPTTAERMPTPGSPAMYEPGAGITPSYPPEPVRPRPISAYGAYVTEQLAALALASHPPQSQPQPAPQPQRFAAPTPRAVGAHHLGSPAESLRGSPSPAGDLRQLGSPGERFREETIPHARDFPEPPSEHVLDSFAATLAAAESAQPPVSAPSERWSVPPPSRVRSRAGVNIEKRLLSFGMSERFARELIETASAHVLPLAPGGGLTRGVRAALAQRIPVAPPLPTRGAAILVVGSGGSGKTSYCAALLQAYRKNSVLPASYAAITWDPERAGLNMLLSPHLMTPSPIDAPRSLRALRRVRGEGLAVLDTPRLSRADRGGVRELARMIGELTPERVVVALPATLGAAAAAQLLDALRPLGANALVVTHADETDQIGVAVEAACTFGLAPEYLLDRGRSGGWRVGRMDPSGLAARLLR